MAYLDIEKIINGTPDKRIFHGYQAMKENYNEDTAKQYQSIYKVEPLSAILNNSEYIFTEAYEGMDFYKQLIFHPSNCLFTRYRDEYDKVNSFYESYKDQMESDQKLVVEKLLSDIQDTINEQKNVILLADYVKENVNDMIEENLSKAIYHYHLCLENGEVEEVSQAKDTLISIFESIEEPGVALLYLPFVSSSLGNNSPELNYFVTTEFTTNDIEYPKYTRCVTMMQKLKGDPFYESCLHESVYNSNIRIIIESYQSENLLDKMNSFLETTSEKEHLIYHKSAENALNALFEEETTDSLYLENDNEKIYDIYSSTLTPTSDLLLLEYYQSDDNNDKAVNYSLINGDVTLEEAIGQIINYENASGVFTEEEHLEDDDEEFPTLRNSRSDHPNRDKPNFFRRIQTKAQDAKMDRMRKKSEKLKNKLDRQLAVQAASEKPKEVVDNIKNKFDDFDEWDDKRRKDFMAKPGFRKKWFKNLKLAILYGGTAAYKVTLLPIAFMVRHFSKMKDRRIRNELLAEIETDIKVCDEKINDAQAEGDKQKKYALIRIRDELTRNLNRVKFNSKYI